MIADGALAAFALGGLAVRAANARSAMELA